MIKRLTVKNLEPVRLGVIFGLCEGRNRGVLVSEMVVLTRKEKGVGVHV